MKKYLLALLAVITIGLTASAVKPEITLSYGGYNQMDACDNHDGWGNVNTSWGSLNAGINFPVTRNFSFGPSCQLAQIIAAFTINNFFAEKLKLVPDRGLLG